MYLDTRLWALTRGVRLRMLACALLGLLALASGIARFALLGLFLARLFDGAGGAALGWPLAAAAAVIVLRGVLEHGFNRLANDNAARIQTALRARLHDRIVALGPAWFGGQRTGGVTLAVVDGVEQLQSYFGRYLPQLFVAACAPVVIVAFIAWWDLPVALVLLAAALGTLALPLAAHAGHRDASHRRSQAFKAFGEEFLDAMQGLPTLKAFGQSRAWGERLAARARALSDNTFQVLGREVSARFFTDLGITVGAAAALALGAWRVSEGRMSLAALLVVLMAGTEIFRPLRDLRGVLHQGLLGHSAAASVHALLQAESSAPQGPATPRASAPVTTVAAADASAAAPALALRNVTFAYPGHRRPAHEGLSLELQPGERVGIVGPSGAGKSTLVRLLLRLFDPQQGTIELDGRDLRTLDPQAVRERIALVAQDSMLFHGTVEENLRLARPEATNEQLQAAATAANAHDFIMALPQGYRTMLGERGTQLSGGQRQRLAIARALLRDAPILILDEALSSVDARNEAEIQQALDRASRNRTTLVLAHRLSSVIDADRILVLDGGRVVESGTHASLMAGDTLYRRLMGEQQAQSEFAAGPRPGAAQAATRRAAHGAVDGTARGAAHAAAQGAALEPAHEAVDGVTDASVDAAADATVDAAADAGHERGAAPATRAAPATTEAMGTTIGLRQVIGMLLDVIRPWRGRFAVTVASGVGRVAAFIGVSALSALVIAQLKTGGTGAALPVGLLAGLFAAALAAAALHWLESWLAHAVAYDLLAEMRIALYAKLEALAPAYLLRRRSGELTALATQDVETVEYFFAHTVAPAIVAVLVPLVVLGALTAMAWPLALALLPFLAWAGASPWFSRRRIDLLGGRARQALSSLAAHLAETIQGLAELVAFSAASRRRAAFLDTVRAYQAVRLELLADLSRQSARLEAATGLGGLAVAAVGAWCVTQGRLPAEWLPLAMLLSVAAFLPVSEIAQVGRQLADTLAATRRLCAIHAEPVRITDGPRSPPLPAGGLPLAFEHVGFTYPGRTRPALRDVTLAVPAGATLALVGPSGAGKSTIASLLLRFWDPQQGTVRIGGVALPELQLEALYRRIALVAQDTWLLNGSLEDNIRLARPEATAAELARAIERAALGDFVAGLPEGLDTPVGERGVALSGGQRQRIAIARAFLRDAPILILDEATSHLDALSEARVHQALTELMRNRTTLVIAHRLSTIRQADTIAVVADGRIVESGSHQALLRLDGAYAALMGRQMRAA
ncbi:MAG: ATP-binding cassette domain-containing protein [Lautropia sp.]